MWSFNEEQIHNESEEKMAYTEGDLRKNSNWYKQIWNSNHVDVSKMRSC